MAIRPAQQADTTAPLLCMAGIRCLHTVSPYQSCILLFPNRHLKRTVFPYRVVD